MKNVNEHMLKNCIYIRLEDFISVIHETLGNDVHVEVRERLLIVTDEEIYYDEVCEALAQYFGVKEVKTYHYDAGGVWICYENGVPVTLKQKKE